MNNDQWRQPAGWAALAAAALVLLAGWYGVQGNAVVAVQMPYLLSGGLGGLALVILGVFLLSSADYRADRKEVEALRLSVEVLEDEISGLRELLLEERSANGSKPSRSRERSKRTAEARS